MTTATATHVHITLVRPAAPTEPAEYLSAPLYAEEREAPAAAAAAVARLAGWDPIGAPLPAGTGTRPYGAAPDGRGGREAPRYVLLAEPAGDALPEPAYASSYAEAAAYAAGA